MSIAGWSYRQVGESMCVGPMKIWRRKRKDPEGILEEVRDRLGEGDGKGNKSGPKRRAEVSKDLRAYRGIFEVRKSERGVKDREMVREWMDLVEREIDRGVQKTDIARESGMTRDQFNYRMKVEKNEV